MKGGVSLVVAPPPPPPPRPQAKQLIFFKLSSGILTAGKANLKAIELPQIRSIHQAGKVVDIQVATDVIAGASMEVQISAEAVRTEEVIVSAVAEHEVSPTNVFSPLKKAKISSDEEMPRDPRLRNRVLGLLSSSPVLHHKVSGSGGQQGDDDSEGVEHDDSEGVKTNLFGVKYIVWFDLGIEGKDSMNPDEEDWGGRLEFGYSDKKFSVEIEDYFAMFEDDCSIESHSCFGRISAVLFDKRDIALKPPDYDERNIIELLEKYSDAHILDSGWREVDPEEWIEK